MKSPYFLAISLIFLISCTSKQLVFSNKTNNEFYTPPHWQEPISLDSKASQEPSFQPNFGNKPQTFQPDTNQMNGKASWYGPGFHGKKTANGETYNQNAMTGAHKILPMNTWLRIKNLENNKTAVIRINDRGPYKKNRIIDLSKRAAKKLGFAKKGTASVSLEVIKYPIGYNHAKGLKPYKQTVVQIAVFNAQSRAKNYKYKLQNRYKRISFMIDEQKKGYYQVLAGPFDDRSHAVTIASNLKSDGIDNFIRSFKK